LMLEIGAFDPSREDESLLIIRGRELGYDLKPARAVVAVETLRPENVPPDRRREVQAFARRAFPHPQDIVSRLGEDKTVILAFLGLAAREENPLAEVVKAAGALANSVGAAGIPVVAGIGEIAFTPSLLGEAFRSASEAALLAARKCQPGTVRSIAEVRLESLLSHVPRDHADRFCSTVLENLPSCPDAAELIETFLAWCEEPFSPARAAARLSIHRNTLAYRLDKLGRVCSVDLRKIRGILMLRAALELRKDGRLPGSGKTRGDA